MRKNSKYSAQHTAAHFYIEESPRTLTFSLYIQLFIQLIHQNAEVTFLAQK